MADEYKLEDLYITWDSGSGAEEMPQVTHYGFGQEGGDVPLKDITHSGDSQTASLDGLPRHVRETATIKARDQKGTAGYYSTLRANTPQKGTIVIYPRGTAADQEMFTAIGWITNVSQPETLFEDVASVDISFVCSEDAAADFKFTRGATS